MPWVQASGSCGDSRIAASPATSGIDVVFEDNVGGAELHAFQHRQSEPLKNRGIKIGITIAIQPDHLVIGDVAGNYDAIQKFRVRPGNSWKSSIIHPLPPANTSGIGRPPASRYRAYACTSKRWFLLGSIVPTLNQNSPAR